MPAFDAFAGSRITSARITRGAWGAASGDVAFAEDTAVATRGTLTIGNASLVMAVHRQGGYGGSRSARLVAGAGGWLTTAPRQFYRNPLGIKLSTVLRDVAARVGESVVLSAPFASQVVGVFWSREEAPASRTLGSTVGKSWYVDAAGVTQIGTWPTVAIASAFDVTEYDPARGLYTIATEDPAAWVPGATFTKPPIVPGVVTVSSVSIVLDDEQRLRLEVFGS